MILKSYTSCLNHTPRPSLRLFIGWLLSFIIIQNNSAYGQSVTWADSCNNSSFTGQFTQQGFSSSDFNSIHEFPNGDLCVTGGYGPGPNPGGSSKTYGLVARMTNTGQIIWVKYIGNNDPWVSNETQIDCATVTANGDIVISTHTTMNQMGGKILIRLDGNGNTIWKKNIVIHSTAELTEHIIETSDGGFLLGSVAWMSATLLKVNNAGNMIWHKGYANTYYTNCRSIAETPTGYYFTGYAFTGFPTSSSYNLLVKINKSTGDTIWTRTFGETSAANGHTEFGYDRMLFHNNQLYLHGSTSVNYSGPNTPAAAIIRFNENGDITDSKRIEMTGSEMARTSLFRSRTFDPRTNSGFHYESGDNSDISVYRLDPQYNSLWAWRIPLTGRELGEDMEVLRDSSIAICFDYSDLSIRQQGMIIKVAANGQQNCVSVPMQVTVSNTVVNTSHTFLQANLASIEPSTDSPLPVFDATGYQWETTCSSVNTCRLSRIDGPDTICNTNSYLYKVTRDGACMNPVNFYSPDPGVQFQVVSDTSVNITCSSPGIKEIYAAMPASCGTLRDTLEIVVTEQEPDISLGNDQYLCQPSLILHAGYRYKTYTWNNQSTDSTLVVSTPGTYYVTVTDYCNHISSDTVHVLAAPPISYSIGNDTAICRGDTITLYASPGFYNYQWHTAYNTITVYDSIIRVFPLTDTFYIASAEKYSGCLVRDTVRIQVNIPSSLTIGRDTSICEHATLTINATPSFNSYLWNTNTTGPFITIQEQGLYSVAATDVNGCVSRDSISVLVNTNPVPVISKYSTICTNANRTLTLSNIYAAYSWQDNSNQPTYTATDTGWYAVMVTDANGCTGKDSVHIMQWVLPPANFLPPDTSICFYDEIDIIPGGSYSSYNWSNGSSTPFIHVRQATIYWLDAMDLNSCTGRDSMIITSKQGCIQQLTFPNAFTPNYDGLNDDFKPKCWGRPDSYRLTIYNRWGEKIFETKDVNKGWDGTISSSKQPTAVFIYQCTYQFKDEPVKYVKGSFTLIR